MATKLALLLKQINKTRVDNSKNKITHKTLHELTGISTIAIQEMVTGTKPILPHHKKLIAKALNVSESELDGY